MRTFLMLALLAGVALWAGWRTPRGELHQRVLRGALFVIAAIFAALLASAIVQALFDLD